MRFTSLLVLCALALGGLAACGQQTPEDMLAEAEKLLSNQDTYGAEVKLTQVMEKFPGTPQSVRARADLAGIYLNSKDFDKAEQQYDKLVEELGGPATPDGYKAFGGKLRTIVLQKDFKRTINVMLETSPTLKALPVEARVYFMMNLYNVYLLDKQLPKARETLDGLMRIAVADPASHPPILAILPQIAPAGSGGEEQVLDFYKQFNENFPQSPARARVLFQIAMLQRQMGKEDDAKKSLAEAIALQKEMLAKAVGADEKSGSLLQLGNLYQVSDALQDAHDAYARIIDQYPQSAVVPEALFFQAQVEAGLGNMPKAQDNLRRIIVEFPNSPKRGPATEALQQIMNAGQQATTATTQGAAAMTTATAQSDTAATTAAAVQP